MLAGSGRLRDPGGSPCEAELSPTAIDGLELNDSEGAAEAAASASCGAGGAMGSSALTPSTPR